MTIRAQRLGLAVDLQHRPVLDSRLHQRPRDGEVYEQRPGRPDADVFAGSPGSQLDLLAGPAGPPPRDREQGWPGPPRLAAESFISYGVFADPAEARPHARLSGTVLNAEPRVCALTRQPFTVATVRTAGFEADVCLAGSEHTDPPAPGSIISGTVVLSAAIDAPLTDGQAS